MFLSRYLLLIAVLAVALSINISCKKINDVSSDRLATESTNWKTLEDARGNLLGIYGLCRSATVSDNTHWLTGDLRDGDFVATKRTDLKAIIEGRLTATSPVLDRISNWRRFYAVINAASLFIERSPEILKLDARYTELNNKVDIAQARMVRAFAYFYMTRIWGDVPLIISSKDGIFTHEPRTSSQTVLNFCTNELLSASGVLPFRYGDTDPIFPGAYYSGGFGDWEGIIWTRLSAYAILAHIAAWQGNYIDVANYTKYIFDNQTQLIGLNFMDMPEFTENSGKSPFAANSAKMLVGFNFRFTSSLATANGHIEQLTLAAPLIPKDVPDMYVPKDSINKIFTDPADLRFSKDPITGRYRMNYFLNYTSELPLFCKIKVINQGNIPGLYFASATVFTRLEELALLRAEALAVLGKPDEAIQYLNIYADRRKVSAYTPSSSVSLIDAIFAERRRELMGEGWRWYDVVRYQRIKQSANTYIVRNGQPLTFKQFEDAGGIYWPVSADILSSNPAITQNSYWLNGAN